MLAGLLAVLRPVLLAGDFLADADVAAGSLADCAAAAVAACALAIMSVIEAPTLSPTDCAVCVACVARCENC